MSQTEANTLTSEVVAEYLRDHPDFFVDRPELLDRLALPHQDLGTVSLVHIQMNRQRQRIEEFEEEITALMSLAANNDKTFHEFMDLQEQILKRDTLDDVIKAIEEKARSLGLLAYVRLFESSMNYPQFNKEQYQRFASSHLNGKTAYLGRMRKADRENLFGECARAPELGSYVVLPLSKSGLQGILAFSSDDGGHFQPHMDTLFLRHLALVLSHLISTLPWQSQINERISTTSS
ncbi:DUF484 family protein [Vibrio sinensis]|uniref:DUF484 family protein n=1 Tax=Vibrio sinensis TaxID=2302434 RepID=A0A3A6QB41_9VIBR|nr:DUF484 family protein [Vibrio sinensis]RJX65293.1 DUF484 family protein [Vibrio sinensis]